MCGEHFTAPTIATTRPGSSPHVRGALLRLPARRGRRGIIPACAGSTPRPSPPAPTTRDHPRMCGEHMSVAIKPNAQEGSSPHVRGALGRILHDRAPGGIIPACAGSTERPITRSGIVKGSSPHVRGALDGQEAGRLSGVDHPRMCGEHGASGLATVVIEGSSPHVRGARRAHHGRPVPHGIIPACAGSTSDSTNPGSRNRDHPRMCGEHRRGAHSSPSPRGSSPHVRGAPQFARVGACVAGIIPACAGSTPLST